MTGRDRIMIAVVVLALLVAGGWFLVLSPQREEASQLSGDVATQRQQLDQALSDVAAGLAAKRGYAHAYATVAQLGTAVPADDDVTSLVVQVQAAADATKIDFRSLKVGQSSGAGAAAPPPPTAPSPASTAPPTGASGAAGATPAAATQATTATLPPGASVGAAGFPTMPFSFQFDGSFFTLDDFVGRLERFLVVRNRQVSVSGRFMTVDGISLSAAPQGFPRIQASVAATTYLLPPDQGPTGGATPSGPGSATPAAAAGASGTTSGGGAAPATATATSAVR
jgi:type II secretion system (T2SS) protein M